MHRNVDLINRFYSAFARRDAEGMIVCYDATVEFSDPVFPDLKGERAMAMWRMLCERGKDLRIEYRDVEADETTGRAHWEAWYTFSATGTEVHNSIDALFEFRNGKIVRHRDYFSFYAWAAQALGVTGKLLGWSGMVKNKVRRQAGANLDKFMAKRGVD
jgi:ketosteroid isomerase-like protein